MKWGIEHFHLYLYGLSFKVVTDHKSLVSIFANPTAKPSVRFERWCLQLQKYHFDAIYRPGSTNPADYMLRHPNQSQIESNRATAVTEKYANFVLENACMKAITLSEIGKCTKEDQLLQNVITCLDSGNWYKYKSCEEMQYI